MVLLPFVGGLMKTASAWSFRQREVPDTDIVAVNQFFWLHFILVFAGLYSLQYAADVDETKQSLHELNTTMSSLNTTMYSLTTTMYSLNQDLKV